MTDTSETWVFEVFIGGKKVDNQVTLYPDTYMYEAPYKIIYISQLQTKVSMEIPRVQKRSKS